ncbi:alpha/beta hydrolase [Rhodococcus fascians]|nr:alpha/beta hydrolase [Rhodococcus fascians]MBY3995187.1 alpha/beta hydrolase [Rhodococcus fascians]MBY4000493.1 alpha/beta hydrolase [Rhodococcus fascians]MBY4005521.1 alpha/beta hydrolase [Rhodococcus fascians]MBY4016354.1 alpha/beta hydrolase [Rhodococcus fascians]
MTISVESPDSDTGEHRSIWTYLYRMPHTLGYVEAAGYRTRYLEAGVRGRPAVVMLHGTAGSVENFSANIAAYAEHFHVVAIDMIGCGWTDKPSEQVTPAMWSEHVLAVMTELGVQRASFVGVSLGSWVAARAAIDHPERVDRLVMVAATGIVVDAEEYAATLVEVRARRMRAAKQLDWAAVKAIFTRLFHDERKIMDDLVAVRLGMYSDPAMQAAMPYLVVVDDEGVLTEEQWRSFGHPVQIFDAVDAPNMYLRNGRRIAELAPDTVTVELTDCDHWGQFEQADIFNAESIAFLLGQTR